MNEEERKEKIMHNLRNLKKLREDREQYSSKYEKIYTEFKELNKEIFENLESNRTQMEQTEEVLRRMAIEEFQATQKKSLTGGLGIREKEVVVYDEDNAFSWALQHTIALKLNKKEFEKLVEMLYKVKAEKKYNLDSFTEIKTESKATIPTKIEV